jgi:predicted MPP superfamily phosphohydrolase
MDRVRDQNYFRMRRLWLRMLDALLFRGVVAQWSYDLGLHGRLRISRYALTLSASQPLPAPLLFAFASDFHAGPQTHPALFASLVDEINQAHPDVVLLGGDYVSSSAHFIEVLAEKLEQLAPRFGTYGVLGNHDWWTDDAHIIRALETTGVKVLVNTNCSLPEPFGAVSICGIDDPWTGNADPVATFAGAGPIRLFLTHSPDGLLLRPERFDIALAGHTHGGQVALPNGTQILTAGGPLSRRYGRGEFDIAGNGRLIVSLGVGCSNIPVRINSDPELVLLTLRPSP